MKYLNARTIITFSLVAIITFSGIISCKKSSTPASKSRTELLTTAGWKILKDEVKTGAGPYVDVTSSYLPCELDNVGIFRVNATYEFNEGATKCSRFINLWV